MLNVQKKKEKLAALKNQLSDSSTDLKVGKVINKETPSTSSLEVPIQIKATTSNQVADPLAEKLQLLASAIEKLSSKNQDTQVFSTKKEWYGEIDPNHTGIVDTAKTVHHKFKKVELSRAFSGLGPFGKGNNSTIIMN